MSAPWEHLILSDCGPAVSRDVIKSVSAKIGLPFPKLYADFFLAHNGGPVENMRSLPRRFPMQGCKQDTHGLIQVFFNISRGDVVNLARQHKVFRSRIPPGLLPIASDPGGNLICVACKGKRKGQVFFWDHNFEANADEGEEVGWDNVYFIADNLDEFFRGLEPDPEDRAGSAIVADWDAYLRHLEETEQDRERLWAGKKPRKARKKQGARGPRTKG